MLTRRPTPDLSSIVSRFDIVFPVLFTTDILPLIELYEKTMDKLAAVAALFKAVIIVELS